MRELAEAALALVPEGVEYADVRVVQRRHEGLHVENGRVGQALYEENEGIGVRVLAAGRWGFAATAHLDRERVGRAVARATAQARAAARLGEPVRLAPVAPVRDTYATPLERDPFEVPVEEKLELLFEASAGMRTGGRALRTAEASVDCFRDTKVFASTEGTLLEQVITETGGGLMATAADADDVQRRSFPQSVPRAIRGQRGDFATAGWEHVLSLGLVEEAPRVGEEAVALLSAAECPPTRTTLIVGGTQMALLVHETAGHAAELDRVLGSEASLAGGSYMQPELRGRLQFGAEIVTITADATLRGGIGSFAYDDEGVRSQRTTIVDHGVFSGYLTSRESAGALGELSSGAARADGWQRIPLVRMSNVSLEPGETSYEEILGTTEDGIVIDMNRSLSIDDTRSAFRFGAEIGWEVKRGKLGRMLKNCTYSGRTLEFWAACDAVADRSSWRVYGLPSCNKGEPLQVAHVGHGTVPARFRDVRVGA
jgi:TldD protein